MRYDVERPADVTWWDRVWGALMWWKFVLAPVVCARFGHKPFPNTEPLICQRCARWEEE